MGLHGILRGRPPLNTSSLTGFWEYLAECLLKLQYVRLSTPLRMYHADLCHRSPLRKKTKHPIHFVDAAYGGVERPALCAGPRCRRSVGTKRTLSTIF